MTPLSRVIPVPHTCSTYMALKLTVEQSVVNTCREGTSHDGALPVIEWLALNINRQVLSEKTFF